MTSVQLDDDFAPRCQCGGTDFENLETVITSSNVDAWGFCDGKLMSVSNGESVVHWDCAADLSPLPYECSSCHARYSETDLFALLTPDQLATLTKAKLQS